MKNSLRYKELLDMGFERNDIFANDSVWMDQHGYPCFWLEKTLYEKRKERVYVEWEPTEGKIELLTCSKDKDITSRREITEDEMRMLIEVFERKFDLPEPTPSYTMAC